MNQINASENTLNQDVEIQGSIKFQNGLIFNGKINGDLNSENGSLTIGKSGIVKGNINTQKAIIEGNVEGNIYSKEKIELKSNAKVTGDIKASRLAIEEGVTFCGKCEVTPDGVKSNDLSANRNIKKAPEVELSVK